MPTEDSTMALPLGIVCKKCGKVLGTIVAPPTDELIKLGKFVAVCESCAATLASEKGVKLDSAEGWDAAVEELKRG
jgi:ribosomal protein S27E